MSEKSLGERNDLGGIPPEILRGLELFDNPLAAAYDRILGVRFDVQQTNSKAESLRNLVWRPSDQINCPTVAWIEKYSEFIQAVGRAGGKIIASTRIMPTEYRFDATVFNGGSDGEFSIIYLAQTSRHRVQEPVTEAKNFKSGNGYFTVLIDVPVALGTRQTTVDNLAYWGAQAVDKFSEDAFLSLVPQASAWNAKGKLFFTAARSK